MFNGIIFSDSAPANVTGYAWVKVMPDGSREWYSYNKDSHQWVLDHTDIAPASVAHTHPTLGDIDFTGAISVGGVAGLTGSRLIPGVGTLTFTKGILTGFVPA